MFDFFVLFSSVVFIILYTSFSWGFVAYKFYGWFVLSAIPELPTFTITQFVGFLLFMSVMTHKPAQKVKKEYIDEKESTIGFLLTPWIVFLFGSFIQTFFY